MWQRQLRRWAGVIIFLAILRHTPILVEKLYATGFYRFIRNVDLFFLRWVPFSIGDFLYLFFPLWWLREVWKKTRREQGLRGVVLIVSDWTRKIILWFYLLWGLNYFRVPLNHQWHMELLPVSLERLDTLARREIDSLNLLHRQLQETDSLGVHIPYDFDHMRRIATVTYRKNEQLFPRFTESFYVIKPSLLSGLVSYMGVMGYINPFTHESQVNDKYPVVFLPHTMLHELAHQIGYAYENEAEFIGFVEGIHSNDPYFRYSAHLVALQYLMADIRQADSLRYVELRKRLRPGILSEFRKQKEFTQRYRLPFSVEKPYDVFLKINQRGRGLESYNEMVLYLSAYLP